MNSPSKIRDFVIGIDYDDNWDVNEDRGHSTLRRNVTLRELIQEINSIMTVGCNFPQFPPEALPTITYAWDLSNQEDGDCYHEIITELDNINQKEVKLC